MRDTERSYYELFMHILLPDAKTSEHGNSDEDTDRDIETDEAIQELLNDAQGG